METELNGWIKAFRKFVTWRWFKTPNMFHVFSYLLFMANSKDKEWQGIIIKRGQLATGRKRIAADTGISQQSVRTCLENLKSTNEITIQSTSRYSIITINKYEAYQIKPEDFSQLFNQVVNQQPTNNQPTANHKQEEEEDKEDSSFKRKFIKEKNQEEENDDLGYEETRTYKVDPEDVKRREEAIDKFLNETLNQPEYASTKK